MTSIRKISFTTELHVTNAPINVSRMSSVWGMILQLVCTDQHFKSEHWAPCRNQTPGRDMTEKLLKATLNPNTHTHTHARTHTHTHTHTHTLFPLLVGGYPLLVGEYSGEHFAREFDRTLWHTDGTLNSRRHYVEILGTMSRGFLTHICDSWISSQTPNFQNILIPGGNSAFWIKYLYSVEDYTSNISIKQKVNEWRLYRLLIKLWSAYLQRVRNK